MGTHKSNHWKSLEHERLEWERDFKQIVLVFSQKVAIISYDFIGLESLPIFILVLRKTLFENGLSKGPEIYQRNAAD